MAENGLKMYLKNVYEMEKEVYLQEEMCKEILSRKNRLKNWKPQALKGVNVEKIYRVKGEETLGVIGVGGGFLCFIGTIGFLLKGLAGGVPFGQAFVGVLGCLILGVVIAWFFGNYAVEGLRKSEYERRYQEQKVKIDAENNNIEAMNMVAKIEIDRKLKALNEEYSIAKKQLDKTKSILHAMYNKGIIFPKYRNFTAVSSFYEYIDSRRCTRLDGHEGAYNIFESEIRQNLIIQKLDEAVRMLKQIEKNQYMLYDAICETNRAIANLGKNLDSSIKQIDTKMDAVVTNTYISSYNSERALKEQEFQTFLTVNYLI